MAGSVWTPQPGGTTAACVVGDTVVGGTVVAGTVVGATVATVDATACDPSPSGSPLTATATANDTSASTTDPPAISSTRRTSGSVQFHATRDPAAPQPHQEEGLWKPDGTGSRGRLLSPTGGAHIGGGVFGVPGVAGVAGGRGEPARGWSRRR